MDYDNLSDYQKRVRGLVRKVAKGLGYRERWEDEDGKIHFRRHKDGPTPPAPTPPPPPTPPPAPTPHPGGTLGVILHDYEVNGLSRPETIELALGYPLLNSRGELVMGLPETVKALDSRSVPLSREFQFLWFELLWQANASLNRADAVRLFKIITRANAFKTNKTAPPRPFANYVTGEFLGEEPMRTEVIFTGGAIVRLIDYPTITNITGKEGYKVEALDIHLATPHVEFDGKTQNPLVYFATTSQRTELQNGTRRVIPLTGGPTIAVPTVAHTNYAVVAKDRIRVLKSGEKIPSPYNY